MDAGHLKRLICTQSHFLNVDNIDSNTAHLFPQTLGQFKEEQKQAQQLLICDTKIASDLVPHKCLVHVFQCKIYSKTNCWSALSI